MYIKKLDIFLPSLYNALRILLCPATLLPSYTCFWMSACHTQAIIDPALMGLYRPIYACMGKYCPVKQANWINKFQYCDSQEIDIAW